MMRSYIIFLFSLYFSWLFFSVSFKIMANSLLIRVLVFVQIFKAPATWILVPTGTDSLCNLGHNSFLAKPQFPHLYSEREGLMKL